MAMVAADVTKDQDYILNLKKQLEDSDDKVRYVRVSLRMFTIIFSSVPCLSFSSIYVPLFPIHLLRRILSPLSCLNPTHPFFQSSLPPERSDSL